MVLLFADFRKLRRSATYFVDGLMFSYLRHFGQIINEAET